MIKDYYKILNVPMTANKDEVKSAYRKLVKFWHPDVNPNPKAHDKIILINEAYEILFDEEKRKVYDKIYEYYIEQNQSIKYNEDIKNQKQQSSISDSFESELAELQVWIEDARLKAEALIRKGLQKVDKSLEDGFYVVGEIGNLFSKLFAIGFVIGILYLPTNYFIEIFQDKAKISIIGVILSIVGYSVGGLLLYGMLKGGLKDDDD